MRYGIVSDRLLCVLREISLSSAEKTLKNLISMLQVMPP